MRQEELALLMPDNEYKGLTFVDASKVSPLRKDDSLAVYVEDSSKELNEFFLSLQERDEYPWKYRADLKPGAGMFDMRVVLAVGKSALSRTALRASFPVSYWNFAKSLIEVFFFAKTEDRVFIHPQFIALKLPEVLVQYGDRMIQEQGLDLFYDKVLRVGNPYSPEYVEGVWTSFVRNRYYTGG